MATCCCLVRVGRGLQGVRCTVARSDTASKRNEWLSVQRMAERVLCSRLFVSPIGLSSAVGVEGGSESAVGVGVV